jgi:predicted GNAT family N-acyltransferase
MQEARTADSVRMSPLPKVFVRPADWRVDREILKVLREEVFIREQSVPADMEWDEFDPQAHHVIAMADGVPIGTGRLLADGHIGRMAVLRTWRGRGAGSTLLSTLMEMARALGMRRLTLNAQIQAVPFYLRHGFQPEGEEFLDAGIPHRRMWRDL